MAYNILCNDVTVNKTYIETNKLAIIIASYCQLEL